MDASRFNKVYIKYTQLNGDDRKLDFLRYMDSWPKLSGSQVATLINKLQAKNRVKGVGKMAIARCFYLEEPNDATKVLHTVFDSEEKLDILEHIRPFIREVKFEDVRKKVANTITESEARKQALRILEGKPRRPLTTKAKAPAKPKKQPLIFTKLTEGERYIVMQHAQAKKPIPIKYICKLLDCDKATAESMQDQITADLGKTPQEMMGELNQMSNQMDTQLDGMMVNGVSRMNGMMGMMQGMQGMMSNQMTQRTQTKMAKMNADRTERMSRMSALHEGMGDAEQGTNGGMANGIQAMNGGMANGMQGTNGGMANGMQGTNGGMANGMQGTNGGMANGMQGMNGGMQGMNGGMMGMANGMPGLNGGMMGMGMANGMSAMNGGMPGMQQQNPQGMMPGQGMGIGFAGFQ